MKLSILATSPLVSLNMSRGLRGHVYYELRNGLVRGQDQKRGCVLVAHHNEVIINYYGSQKAWVGVWPVDACNPYQADYMAAEIGVGEFKAAFVCEDDKRQPWLVSKTINIDAAPPARGGQCAHRRGFSNPECTYTPCDTFADSLCFDCSFATTCQECTKCEQQRK
ncbi:hypothetical protein MY11210_007419 [Beauveria gryllotalpidicola]